MKMIGRYEILGVLGKGAMGEVYRGRDDSLDRIVAIKVIRDVAAGAKAIERFQREARAAARLNHPNIITVYEFGDHEGCPFIAMEYLEGQDLGDLLDAGVDIPIEKQIDIIRQAASGLHFAHQKGIIHRDIKPANIAVLNDGSVKLMDFGIAKLGDSKITQTGSVMGTVRYMPPEQIQGMDLDGRADLFSLGVTFYEMVTRQRAFDGDSMTNVIYNVMHAEPKPIKNLDGTPHEWLQSVIHVCLEKNREHRWPDCQAFVEALDRREPVDLNELRAALARRGGGARRSTVVAGDAGGEEATREHRVDPSLSRTVAAPAESRRSRRLLVGLALVALLAIAGAVALHLAGSSERAELIARAETAVEESRPGEARKLLLEAQQAGGSPEELAESRARFAALQAPLRAAGDPIAAKAVLDQVVAWGAATPETRADYRELAAELARLGLPEQGPPFIPALQAAVEAYEAGLGGTYRPAEDYPLMSECFELGGALVQRAEEPRLPPHLREASYDLARKLFLFVDEYEPGFNAFEKANQARLERARLAGIARSLDLFKGEVDGLIAEAEKLEADPDTQLQAVGNYRAVLARVGENAELGEYVGLESYRTLAESAIARIEENVRNARQRMSRDAQSRALAREAGGLEEQGNLKGALELYEELLVIEPADPGALARAAELRPKVSRLDDLESSIEEALSKEQVAKARKALDEALALSPSKPELAAFGARLQRLEDARREARQGADMLADAARLRQQGQAEEAERRYLEISSSTNDDAIRRQAGEAVRQIRMERQSAEIQPLVDRARSQEKRGELAAAIDSWSRVERLNSAWPGVKDELRRLRRLESKSQDAAEAAAREAERREKDAAAVEVVRKAVANADPDAAQAALALLEGSSAAGLSELRSSVTELLRRREAGRQALESGEAALALGRFDEAAREAESAAESWPALRPSSQDLGRRAAAAKAAASAPPQATPQRAVEAALRAYSAAVQSADLDALKRVWPGLAGKQLKVVRDGFSFAKSHEVRLKVLSLDVEGSTAVAVCDREDRMETRDGQVVQNRSRATFRLRAGDGGWLIEAIE